MGIEGIIIFVQTTQQNKSSVCLSLADLWEKVEHGKLSGDQK